MAKIPRGSGLRRILASCGPAKKTSLRVGQDLAFLESKKESDSLAAYVLGVARTLSVDFDELEAKNG